MTTSGYVAHQAALDALYEARTKNHLSIRAAARMADVPATTMHGWLSGKHIPTPALRPNFLKFVDELGLSDTLDISWLDPNVDADVPGESPYLGPRPYTIDDAELFFGRDAEIRRLAEAIFDQVPERGLLAVVGASGSGKSSLLAAGLLGRECAPNGLFAGRTHYQLTVADIAAPDFDFNPEPGSLIVVDQCEELLRAPFVPDAIIDIIVYRLAAHSTVVLGLRADAYGQLAEYAEMREALSRPFLIEPMTYDDVQAVVEGPALARGVTLDPGVFAVIARDVFPYDVDELHPSLLPLLSTALMLLWDFDDGQHITPTLYQNQGGIDRAVEELALNAAYEIPLDTLPRMRNLFMRLVEPAGDALVRRALPWSEIDEEDDDIISAYVDARILIATEDDVRLSHDMLLTRWQQLAAWIEPRRDELRLRQQLRQATQLWAEYDRPPHLLLPLLKLPMFLQFLENPELEESLSASEHEYLTISKEHHEKQLDDERQQTALIQRRGRIAVVFGAVAAVLAIIASIAFIDTRHVKLEAQSRQIAAYASSIQARNPNLAAQLAIASHSLADTPESRAALLNTSSVDVPTRWTGIGSAIVSVDSAQTKVVRADGQGQLTVWKADQLTSDPGTTVQVNDAATQLFAVAQASIANRDLVAVGGMNGYRELWDITDTPTRVASLSSGDATTYTLVVDQRSQVLAAGLSDGTVELWSVKEPGKPVKLTTVTMGAR